MYREGAVDMDTDEAGLLDAASHVSGVVEHPG
jgi:hypothetical protein